MIYHWGFNICMSEIELERGAFGCIINPIAVSLSNVQSVAIESGDMIDALQYLLLVIINVLNYSSELFPLSKIVQYISLWIKSFTVNIELLEDLPNVWIGFPEQRHNANS
jgi:hypothetical protein